MDLDNREIAFLTWFVLLAGAILWETRHSEVRRNLFRLLFKRPIVCLIVAVACYVAACVWLLSVPGWWQWSNLKTTLLWTGGFALVAVFNYEKAESGKSYFRATILEAVGITAFFSFISSSYTFGLFTELAIAFALIVLVVLSTITERDGKLESVHKLATVLLHSGHIAIADQCIDNPKWCFRQASARGQRMARCCTSWTAQAGNVAAIDLVEGSTHTAT